MKTATLTKETQKKEFHPRQGSEYIDCTIKGLPSIRTTAFDFDVFHKVAAVCGSCTRCKCLAIRISLRELALVVFFEFALPFFFLVDPEGGDD